MKKVTIRSMISIDDAMEGLAAYCDKHSIMNCIIEEEGRKPLYFYVVASYD